MTKAQYPWMDAWILTSLFWRRHLTLQFTSRWMPLNSCCSQKVFADSLVLTYHPEVQRWRGERRPRVSEKQAKIPMVRVRSVQSVRVLPLQSTVVNVQLDAFDTEYHDTRKSILLEPHVSKNQAAGLQVEDELLQPSFEGKAQVVITNPTGLDIGHISKATIIPSEEAELPPTKPSVRTVLTTNHYCERREEMLIESPRERVSHSSTLESDLLLSKWFS